MEGFKLIPELGMIPFSNHFEIEYASSVENHEMLNAMERLKTERLRSKYMDRLIKFGMRPSSKVWKRLMGK